MERNCDIGGPKYPWPAVDKKMKSSRVGLSLGCHRMIELDDDPGIIEPTRHHERLQMVFLHKEHEVSEPRVCGKCREVVVNLSMEISPPTTNIPRDGVAVEVRSPDDGCQR